MEPPPRGIPGGGRDGPAPSGDEREGQLGLWQDDTDDSTHTFFLRTRPPSHRQAPAIASPTFSRRARLRSCRLRLRQPAPIHRPPEAPPLNRQAGTLAFTRANRRRASSAPAPIRAGWRRGFSNVIEAPPRAPRSLLFGESQAGIELASHPGGIVPLRPELGAGLAPLPAGVCNFPSSVRFPGRTRSSASRFTLLI